MQIFGARVLNRDENPLADLSVVVKNVRILTQSRIVFSDFETTEFDSLTVPKLS